MADQPTTSRIAGTEQLGRPLTDAERKHFADTLRAHDYAGASLAALRFACKLTGSAQAARDIVARASFRLLRLGWDPGAVPLANVLCRITWSEWTHWLEETERARKEEEQAFAPRETSRSRAARPRETRAVHGAKPGRSTARLNKLRERLVEAKDEVNLVWLELSLQGVDDLQEMAARTGLEVTEFYRAADRRRRHVRRLLEEERGREEESGG